MSDDWTDPVYYRIMYWRQIGKLTVVHMQSFDEYDYDENRFLRDENGERMRWDDEAAALKYLNDNFKLEYIDPDCITANHHAFRKDCEDSGEVPENVKD